MSASLATREPVLLRTAAIAVLTVLVHVLVVRGWLPIEADTEVFVASLVDLVGFLVAAVWSRQAVTPVAHPDSQALLREARSKVAEAYDNREVGSRRL